LYHLSRLPVTGTFQFLDGGRLDLGVVRDSALGAGGRPPSSSLPSPGVWVDDHILRPRGRGWSQPRAKKATVSDDLEALDPEWAELLRALVDAESELEREVIRRKLKDITNARAAEADADRAEFTAQMGGVDPEPGVRLVDGGTVQIPPYHVGPDGKLRGGSFDL
jgi:hypothetical protein